MNKIIAVALGLLAVSAVLTIMPVNALDKCVLMCYDPVKNAATKGFDPQFLALPEVKQNCLEAHADLVKAGLADLNYCSKALGTL